MRRSGFLAYAGCVMISLGSGCVSAGNALGVDRRVQAFYYPWYGNPKTDGGWSHWNHPVLLREGGGKHHEPPEDIGIAHLPAFPLDYVGPLMSPITWRRIRRQRAPDAEASVPAGR